MKKRILICLATLGLFVVACRPLYPFSFPTPTKMIGSHVSGLTLHDDNLYFGAGYCLYRLDVQAQTLYEIMCTQDQTFERPAIDGERAYALVFTSPEAEQFLTAIDLSTGITAWRVDESKGIGPYFRLMKEHTFLVDDRIITTQGDKGEVEDRLFAFDAQSGRKVWRTEPNFFHGFRIPFLIFDDLIWYPINRSEEHDSKDGQLVAIDLHTGQLQRTIDLRPEAKFDELLYVDDRWVLGYDDKRMVFAVDRSQPDEIAWQSSWSRRFSPYQVWVHDGSFIIADFKLVQALNATNGHEAWSFDSQKETQYTQDFESLVLFLLIVEERMRLYALDAASGAVVWEYGSVDEVYQFWMSGDVVYVTTSDSIDALELKTGELLWQVEIVSEIEYYEDNY